MERILGGISYQTNASIMMPDNITLEGNMLTWDVEHIGRDQCLLSDGRLDIDEYIVRSHLVPRQISGCLEDFSRLHNATANQVLQFASKRGVLAVSPLVNTPRFCSFHPFSTFTATYREPISVYIALANIVNNIRHVLQNLRTGIPIKKEQLARCFPPDRQPLLPDVTSGSTAYGFLLQAVSFWWLNARISFGMSLSYDVEATDAAGLVSPPIHLHFGAFQNDEWDRDFSLHYRTGDLVTLPYKLQLSLAEPGGEETAMGEGFIQTRNGEWLDSVASFSRREAAIVPYKGQRPSALFNVLTFQLIQAVSSPEDTFFCLECGRMYQHDSEKGNRPRRDKNASFCSPDCKAAHRRKWDNNRKKLKRIREGQQTEND